MIRVASGLIPTVCVILGLVSVTAAGLVVALWLGLLLAGVSLLVLAVLRELVERQPDRS